MNIRLLLLLLVNIFNTSLTAQTIPLTNFEAVLIGPKNTDRHHPVQIDYYLDYYRFLQEEVAIWLQEVEQQLAVIKRRNRKRIRKRKPIKLKDYPQWKYNRELIQSLKMDKQLVAAYIQHWKNYDARPDSVLQEFQLVYDANRCFDVITADIVLSKEEYVISIYEAPQGYFDWNEFALKQKGECPMDFIENGKTCIKNREAKTNLAKPPVYTILNLLEDMPVHLDGWKEITCFK